MGLRVSGIALRRVVVVVVVVVRFQLWENQAMATSSLAGSVFSSNTLRNPIGNVATMRKRLVRMRAPRAEFQLRPLPYELDALEPHMSKETLEFHWGKHHKAYVDNLNKQVEGTEAERQNLSELVLSAYNDGNPKAYFNNAGQIWNHEFFWSSMSPSGGGEPQGELLELISSNFVSYKEFAEQFKRAAGSQFGSGWVWLVLRKDGKLEILKTPNALTPIVWDHIPLLVVDVWEHAYYLDYHNQRPKYLSKFLDNLVSWQAVGERLAQAKAFVNYGEPVTSEL